MAGETYTIIALAMRYFFAAIMLLIALRAWKITVVDYRRARKLRKYAPATGVSGEMLVVAGEGMAKTGMRYAVIREGLIGSARRADVRIRSRSVKRAHALFEVSEKGIEIRTMGAAMIFDRDGAPAHRLLLGDGGHVRLGDVELMVILDEAVSDEVYRPAPPETPPEARDEFDDWLDEKSPAGDAADENPLGKQPRERDFDDYLDNKPREHGDNRNRQSRGSDFYDYLDNSTRERDFDDFIDNKPHNRGDNRNRQSRGSDFDDYLDSKPRERDFDDYLDRQHHKSGDNRNSQSRGSDFDKYLDNYPDDDCGDRTEDGGDRLAPRSDFWRFDYDDEAPRPAHPPPEDFFDI